MFKQTLVIPGQICDLNTYIGAERTNRFKAAKIKKDEGELVWALIKQQSLKPCPRPVQIVYKFYCKNKRKDKSNICAFAIKVIEDSLVTAGVLKNDGWDDIIDFSHEWEIDADNPRIEVDIFCPE